MSALLYTVSSPASVASTGRQERQRNRIDSCAGNCGLCRPTLFRRIGIMAANVDRPPPRHREATPIPSRPDRANGPATGCGWDIDKPSARPSRGRVLPAKTSATAIAAGPSAGRTPEDLKNPGVLASAASDDACCRPDSSGSAVRARNPRRNYWTLRCPTMPGGKPWRLRSPTFCPRQRLVRQRFSDGGRKTLEGPSPASRVSVRQGSFARSGGLPKPWKPREPSP
jgi:hypothetical protein